MSARFRKAAFGEWVPAFVGASNRLSGIERPPSEAQVAAHRGLFARDMPDHANLAMFQRHACGGDGLIAAADAERLDALLEDDLPAVELHDRFLELAPFAAGNGRCARTLWMWARLARGHLPRADDVATNMLGSPADG